jgi:hypothetical protein
MLREALRPGRPPSIRRTAKAIEARHEVGGPSPARSTPTRSRPDGLQGGLGRFCRTYAYVAQLIDFGDPELENFAAFAKLLQKRLSGETPENVDLKGLVLTGFDIKSKEDRPEDDDEACAQAHRAGRRRWLVTPALPA